MTELAVSIALFTAMHGISSTRLRPWFIARFGRKAFMLLLSALTTILFIWMWFAYRRATHDVETVLWVSDMNIRIFSAAIMYIAILLLVWMASNRPRVLISGEHLLHDEKDVRGVLRITRHPMMWPLAMWALVHMLNNGDAAGLLYFGYFAVLATGGTLMIDARRKRHMGAGWAAIAAVSSNVPFAAIISGRNHLDLRELGWWRPLAAFFIWAAILHFHQALTGFAIFL